MKTKKLIIIVLLIFLSVNAYAEISKNMKIKLGNIGGTAIMTLIRGLIKGEVKNFKDVMKMLFWGGMGGYGFYQSKRLISNGKIFPGVLLSNISTSVIENTAIGNHPLSRIGYSFGFIRMNLYTSFKRINFDISPLDVLSFFDSLKFNKIIFKNGIISFRAKKQSDNAIGWSNGIFPVVVENTDEHTYRHEMIHVVQNLQLTGMSYEPFFQKEKPRLFNIRTQSFYLIFKLANGLFPYRNNIKEIEAFYFIKCHHGVMNGFK